MRSTQVSGYCLAALAFAMIGTVLYVGAYLMCLHPREIELTEEWDGTSEGVFVLGIDRRESDYPVGNYALKILFSPVSTLDAWIRPDYWNPPPPAPLKYQ